MTPVEIRRLGPDRATVDALATILVETVAGGGSVSFMHPLAPEKAAAFWQGSLDAAARGERVVLGAYDGPLLVGTVTLVTGLPENQPHRAEIAKMMTRASHRGRGIGTALLKAAEAIAAGEGRWLLVLDTASVEGAAGFYAGLGWQEAGEIPDFALTPDGRMSGTRVYWKRLG
ncbi:GNAT family N-acetyltransferase [Chthonobacter albigriseus]|uniref:GNAT family N-acetyltransferase n=1 Tax=Chthonobacter albigriseus TaxID=1683161 RepID=UPI003CC7F111